MEINMGKPYPSLSRIRSMSDVTLPLTVFYNGACPICRAEITHYKGLAARDTLVWRDLADKPDALAAYELTPAQAKRRLYTADADGALYCGVDSFIGIWERLPRYRWLARLTRLPGFYTLAGVLYERLAVPVLAWLNARREKQADRHDAEHSERL